MCRMGNYWDTEGKIFILEVPEECCLNIRGCLYILRVKGKRGHIQSRLLFTWLLTCRCWCLCQAPGKECFSNSSQKVCKGVFFFFLSDICLDLQPTEQPLLPSLSFPVNSLCKGQLCHWLQIPSESRFYMRSLLGPSSRRTCCCSTLLPGHPKSYASVGRTELHLPLLYPGLQPGLLPSLHPTQLASDLNSIPQEGALENPHL